MKRILHTVHIAAPPEAVYAALTTEDGVTGWWTTKARLEPGQGGLIELTFHGDFHPEMRQTRLERDRLVEWSCEAGHDNWRDNRFSFALGREGGATRLRFTQEYAQELADDTYGTYNFNWGYYLNSLKVYCETGTGSPYQVAD